MLFLKRMLFCAVLLLAGTFTARAQTSTPPFPTVAKVDLLPYEDVSSFSNGLEYFESLLSMHVVLDTATDEKFVLWPDLYWTSAGWSPDNSHLAYIKWSTPCTPSMEEGNLFIFRTLDTSVSTHCIPYESGAPAALQWSPFDSNLLAVFEPNVLFNITTQERIPFTFPTTIHASNLADYVGYDQYLWDPATQRPVAAVYLDQSVNYDAHEDGLIEHSTLKACGEQCIPLLDTLSIANVAVRNWVLRGHWLLWLGHWSTTGLPTIIQSDLDIADSAVFLTYLPTGSSQELFRFSSVDSNDLLIPELNWSPDTPVVSYLSWSPDANTIVLDLESANFDRPLPTLVPGIARGLMDGGFVLHLNWPAEAN